MRVDPAETVVRDREIKNSRRVSAERLGPLGKASGRARVARSVNLVTKTRACGNRNNDSSFATDSYDFLSNLFDPLS